MEAMSNPSDLRTGDHIEIKYRALLADGAAVRERWIGAEIKKVDGGRWPLARLDDGQFTEIRRYMQWRYCAR
jgi:hypothetical protein